MELIITRITKTKTYTMGRLSLQHELGATYICDTLEPSIAPTDHKLPRAIQPGRYAVAVTWSPKFRQWLPLLLNVPRRTGIRIHAGNTPADTLGCILPGTVATPGRLYNSRRALAAIMTLLKERPEGEAVHIRIEN